MEDQCPKLNMHNAPLNIITANTINEIQLSTYNRSIGTVVDIHCYGERLLKGVNSTTCQQNATWDYPYLPTCEQSDSVLTKEQLIITGVFCGLGALLLIVVFAIIIALAVRRRRERNEKIDYNGHTWMSLFEDKDTWRYKDASVYSYVTEQAGYRPFSGYRSTYHGDWHRHLPSTDNYENPPPRTTLYGYTNRSYPMELEADTPYRFVHRNSTRDTRDNEVYRGMDADRKEYKSMNHYNRQAEMEGRDPFLWRTESPRSFYD